jgi:hypothetical protein
MLDGSLNDTVGVIHEIYEDSTYGTSYIIKIGRATICGISKEQIEIFNGETWDDYFNYISAVRKREKFNEVSDDEM